MTAQTALVQGTKLLEEARPTIVVQSAKVARINRKTPIQQAIWDRSGSKG